MNCMKNGCITSQDNENSEGTIFIPDAEPPVDANGELQVVGNTVYPDIYSGHFDSQLISHDRIVSRTKQIAQSILDTYYSSSSEINEPLVLVCILKGSNPFYSLLCNELSLLSVPYILEFLRVKSYVGLKSSGNTKSYKVDIPPSLKGRNAIVVEDIVDTGKTLSAIMPQFYACEPKSVHVCTLLVKRLIHDGSNGSQKPVEGKIIPKFVGFSIPDLFVIGFGLDYNEMYRDVLDVMIISQKGIDAGGYKDN